MIAHAVTGRVAIVTGGLRGLGKAMTMGLARDGHFVLAIGHIADDVRQMYTDTNDTPVAKHVVPLVADLREPVECDRVVKATMDRFGAVDILINNAGLTFTYIWPDLYRRATLPKFWEATDEVIQDVMDTNYVAADQMARRVAPRMVEQGWGRIVNITTKLDTMNRATSSAYGASKAALEMATVIWAGNVVGTGLTINIVNPGDGANTPGIAEEMRAASSAGRITRLVEPEQMVPPLLWVISAAADKVNGYRFDANTWDPTLQPAEAARRAGRPAGFQLQPSGGPM